MSAKHGGLYALENAGSQKGDEVFLFREISAGIKKKPADFTGHLSKVLMVHAKNRRRNDVVRKVVRRPHVTWGVHWAPTGESRK